MSGKFITNIPEIHERFLRYMDDLLRIILDKGEFDYEELEDCRLECVGDTKFVDIDDNFNVIFMVHEKNYNLKAKFIINSEGGELSETLKILKYFLENSLINDEDQQDTFFVLEECYENTKTDHLTNVYKINDEFQTALVLAVECDELETQMAS